MHSNLVSVFKTVFRAEFFVTSTRKHFRLTEKNCLPFQQEHLVDVLNVTMGSVWDMGKTFFSLRIFFVLETMQFFTSKTLIRAEKNWEIKFLGGKKYYFVAWATEIFVRKWSKNIFLFLHPSWIWFMFFLCVLKFENVEGIFIGKI